MRKVTKNNSIAIKQILMLVQFLCISNKDAITIRYQSENTPGIKR